MGDDAANISVSVAGAELWIEFVIARRISHSNPDPFSARASPAVAGDHSETMARTLNGPPEKMLVLR